MAVCVENQLEIQFPDSVRWSKLDAPGTKIPNGMMFVDLIIDRENDILLVEIKDPSNSRTPENQRMQSLKGLQDNSLISQMLTPKVRDSYTYLHLMMRDDKPVKYVVLLGLDAFDGKTQQALLVNFKDRLLSNIQCECDTPWQRSYIADCIVMSVDGWNERFKGWPIKRLSQQGLRP